MDGHSFAFSSSDWDRHDPVRFEKPDGRFPKRDELYDRPKRQKT
jgi:hypothetical protein